MNGLYKWNLINELNYFSIFALYDKLELHDVGGDDDYNATTT